MKKDPTQNPAEPAAGCTCQGDCQECTQQAPKAAKPRKKAAPPPDAPQEEGCACDCQEELQAAQKQAAEYLDMAQRIKAEFENYKRRTQTAQAEATQKGKADAVLALLPVLDNLQRALDANKDRQEDDPFVQGIVMVTRQFEDGLAGLSVEAVDGMDQPFDPAYQCAVGQSQNPDVQPGTVTQVLQRGYRMGEAVIRPAMVMVQGEA